MRWPVQQSTSWLALGRLPNQFHRVEFWLCPVSSEAHAWCLAPKALKRRAPDHSACTLKPKQLSGNSNSNSTTDPQRNCALKTHKDLDHHAQQGKPGSQNVRFSADGYFAKSLCLVGLSILDKEPKPKKRLPSFVRPPREGTRRSSRHCRATWQRPEDVGV